MVSFSKRTALPVNNPTRNCEQPYAQEGKLCESLKNTDFIVTLVTSSQFMQSSLPIHRTIAKKKHSSSRVLDTLKMYERSEIM